jgi:hypothetical protein
MQRLRPVRCLPRPLREWHVEHLLRGPSSPSSPFAILEFLDTDVFNVSAENCVSFLDPIIDSWDIDLKTFGPKPPAYGSEPQAI